MEEKIKHLEFIQDIIKRMAQNSFYIKGWTITLITAILALTNKSSCILYFIVFIFFLLDTYFLYQEKNFISLYNKVRNGKEKNFNLKPEQNFTNFYRAFLSIPNFGFYLLLIILIFNF